MFRRLQIRGMHRTFSSTSLPDFDIEYYCSEKNIQHIKKNIESRKGVGNIGKVLEIFKVLNATKPNDLDYQKTLKEFYTEISKIPNKTHPDVLKYNEEPYKIQDINKLPNFGEHKPLEFSEITRKLNLMRTDKLGQTCGHRSYYFSNDLAELEEALIKYSVTFLLNSGFQLISVPDILSSHVLESCGMSINSDRIQIYSLDPHHHGPDSYLSGTAEMSLAGLLMNTTHNIRDLPIKLAAVSRCFRAETSSTIEERGIYRVHQFTKVEMFTVTTSENSAEMLEYIRDLQQRLFTPLGIHMRVLDMPPHELGAPAYRKYDIEAWMPGRNSFGEISSCSNCTDFQSRRLHIKYQDEAGNSKHVHTLNGTACAIPRMLIAILETHQHPKGKIIIPDVLRPFINGKEFITKNNSVPELKLNKIKK